MEYPVGSVVREYNPDGMVLSVENFPAEAAKQAWASVLFWIDGVNAVNPRNWQTTKFPCYWIIGKVESIGPDCALFHLWRAMIPNGQYQNCSRLPVPGDVIHFERRGLK